MEIIHQDVNDILLLFKTKIQDAICLIENMPNDTRRDVWQFWKEVSKIVRTTTKPRPIKAKWRVQQMQIKSEPRIEVIKENEELELSIMHLEEHVERQDGDHDEDASDVNLPIAFTQDLETAVAVDKEHSYGYAPDLQLLYSSVYSSETANTAVYSSEANSITVCSSETPNTAVYSSEAATTAVYSSEANSMPVGSSEAANTPVYSSEGNTVSVCSSEAGNISYEAVTTAICSSESTHVPTDIAKSSDSSFSLLDTIHDTCEVYTTDGTSAILVSTEIQVQDAEEIPQEQPKRRRGRPKKVPTNDVSQSNVKSLPSTVGIKVLSSRPKRTKKARESSIYYYSDGSNRRKENNGVNYQSDHDSDGQENSEHLFDENHVEMGDKENEAEDGISSNEKRKQLKSGSTYDLGPVICPECGVQLAYSSSLAAHMRKHSGARPFKCSSCDKGFTTKANMLRHELTHTGARPFPCPSCDKAFTEAKSLEVHNRTHTGEKPYVCKICNASFRQRGTLQAHIYCHTGHKGHLCDVCGKAFRQKTQLREHQKRHTNNRTVKCDVCEKMFYGKGELFRHSLQHSGARPYKCSLCQKTFTRLQYLREHTNIHTGNKPHVCRECSTAFHDMASLYRHQAKHKLQAKKAAVETVDIKKELFGSEVVIVNNNATDEDLQDLIAEASENGQIQVSHSTDNQLQAAAQSIIDASLPITQVYQITYVDEDNEDLGRSSRSENGQMLPTVDFSAINLLANATQLSLGQ